MHERLGLRAGEVARLELSGVDFDCGVLHAHRSKRGGPATFPIPRKLSKALKAYLRNGRPTCTAPTVFVSHWPPGIGKPIRSVTISVMVKRWAARAGLRKDIGAAHVLRHSIASRMLSAGASLRQIADVLGHRSIDTTTIYAKVDLKALSGWPTLARSQGGAAMSRQRTMVRQAQAYLDYRRALAMTCARGNLLLNFAKLWIVLVCEAPSRRM